MTAAIGASARGRRADHRSSGRQPRRRPASIESDDDEQRCVRLLAEVEAGSRASATARRLRRGLLRRSRPRRGPRHGRRPGARHRTGGHARRRARRRNLLGGDVDVRDGPAAWPLAKTYTPNQCLGVYACDIPVLRIDSDPNTIEPIGDLCEPALAQDGSRAIVLGCAAMARFAAPLTQRLGVPVIDGVVAATLLAEACRLRPQRE